jgi:crooked neck
VFPRPSVCLALAFVCGLTRGVCCGQHERARVIYKYALDHLPKARAQELYALYTQFEKQYGNREGIEDVVVAKRRFQYEEVCTLSDDADGAGATRCLPLSPNACAWDGHTDADGGRGRHGWVVAQEIKAAPTNYDLWFDYLRLEEANGTPATVRDVYERAVAALPPGREKRLWRRYIFLWLNYALYEELDAEVRSARAFHRAYAPALTDRPGGHRLRACVCVCVCVYV